MLSWIIENASTIIISAVLIAVIAAIISYLINNKKQGKSSCGAGCATCALHGKCHQKQ